MESVEENASVEEIVAPIISNRENAKEFITVQPLKTGISIKFFERPVMKIIYGKNKKYVSISPNFKEILNNSGLNMIEIVKSDPWIRVLFNSSDDLKQMRQLFLEIYDKVYLTFSAENFGCCYRYEECSNQKKCIHPDQLFAKGCLYRTNLTDGKIFYGKNTNIRSPE